MCDACESQGRIVPATVAQTLAHERLAHIDFDALPTDKALRLLSAVEDVLFKATALPEWKRMILLENRLREQLIKSWNARSTKAAKAAASIIRAAPDPVRQRDIDAALAAARAQFVGFDKEVRPFFREMVLEAYKLAISAMNKKVQGKYRGTLRYDFVPVRVLKWEPNPSLRAGFDVLDEEAVEALADDMTFWAGEHYDRNLAESIRRLANESVIQTGGDPEAAGDELERVLRDEYGYDPANPRTGAYARIPAGWSGGVREYWSGVAANAATTGRVYGQLSALRGVGATHYTIVNPLDERTCEMCYSMASEGTAMPVEDAYDHMRSEIGATPNAIRNVLHPWAGSLAAMRSIAGARGPGTASGARAFIRGGVGYPPFHMHCRCTVDISEETEFIPVEELTP